MGKAPFSYSRYCSRVFFTILYFDSMVCFNGLVWKDIGILLDSGKLGKVGSVAIAMV